MGVEKIESLSRVLIRSGAKRVLKDLKGRQPTYYFMNKSDILRLKEEEEAYWRIYGIKNMYSYVVIQHSGNEKVFYKYKWILTNV